MNNTAKVTPIETPADRPLFNRLAEWFDANDWDCEEFVSDDQSHLDALVTCENGTWRMVARVSESLRHAYFWARLDMFVPANRRSAVAEFMARANFDRRMGFFEMDFGDGEIRFRVTLWVLDGMLTDDQIEEAVDTVLADMNRYFPALMSVIYGATDPAEAVTKVLAEEQDATYHKSVPGRDLVEKEIPVQANALLH